MSFIYVIQSKHFRTMHEILHIKLKSVVKPPLFYSSCMYSFSPRFVQAGQPKSNSFLLQLQEPVQFHNLIDVLFFLSSSAFRLCLCWKQGLVLWALYNLCLGTSKVVGKEKLSFENCQKQSCYCNIS